MMQTPPISSRDVLVIEEKKIPKPIEAILVTAISIKNFIFGIFGSSRNIEKDSPVYNLDLIQARKFSWAVMAYQKIFERAKIIASPGPGNGYFDTVQILLEQIELLARKFLVAPKNDRVNYFDCFERIFPGAPALTRCLYPAILYFVALRICDECKKTNHVKLVSDFWHAAVRPSEKLIKAAHCLVAGTHNMFNSLRYGSEEAFRTVYPEFEKYWLGFFEQFQKESLDGPSYICPDLEIESILRVLPSCALYTTRSNTAREIASTDAEHYKVVLSTVIFPERLINSTENNRAYELALLLIKQAAKTINTYADGSCHEVKVLEL